MKPILLAALFSSALLISPARAADSKPGAISQRGLGPQTPRAPSPGPAPERKTVIESPEAPQPPIRPAIERVDAGVDLTADKPEAPVRTQTLLDDLVMPPDLSVVGRRTFSLIAAMKKNIEKISVYLDDNGKEIQRLITTSDDLCNNITELAELFPKDEALRDVCSRSKRNALVLTEELSRTPVRKWMQVRWAFNSTLREVSNLRLRARETAEALPKPIRQVDKNGKVEFIEPSVAEEPVDPAVALSEERKRALEIMKARMTKRDEYRKAPPMQVDLDGLKAKD